MNEPTTRERILGAAQSLFWERGFDATSPKAIMAESGSGQGSFYHFFDGKKELAVAAFDEHASAMIGDLGVVFDPKKPGMQRIRDWLALPRKALVGCRLGRLAMENAVVADDDLRTPIERYFNAAHRALRAALRDAQREQALTRDIDPDELAWTLLAVVQGGYVLARAARDADKLADALRGARRLLQAAST